MAIYMKYGKIKGEVKKAGYAEWIELTSAQIGQIRYAGRPTGRSGEQQLPRQIDEVVVTQEQDSSSPLLFQEAISGQPAAVVIEFTRGDPPERFLRLTLGACMISNYSMSAGDKPMASFTLNFSSILVEASLHD